VVDAALDAGSGTGGRTLVVEGPAGIGRTRLLTEVRDRLRGLDRPVIMVRAAQLEQQFAYGVVRQVFEPVMREASPAYCARLLSGAAAQAATVFGTPSDRIEPVGDLAVLHGLYWLVVNACSDAPQTVLIDDVQHADAPTLRLLAYLLPRLDGVRLTLVLALTAGAPVPDTLAEVLHATGTRILRPPPLTLPGAAALLTAAFGTRPDDAFVAACQAATGGNPMLLTELARGCVEQGVAPVAGSVTRVATVRPSALGSQVGAHLAALPAEVVAVAHAVAVLGEEAEFAAVAAVAGTTVEAAATAADRLIRAHLLTRELDGGRVRYPYEMLRAAVYEHAGPRVRLRGHRAAVRHLATVGADPERVAAHILQVPARGVPNTAGHLRRAAETALGRGSPQSAYTYLRRAVPEVTGQRERRVLFDLLADVALHTDVVAAAESAADALALTTGMRERTAAGLRLGTARLLAGDVDGAVQAWRAARTTLSSGTDDGTDDDARHALDAYLVNVTVLEPGRLDLAAGIEPVPAEEGPPSVGGRALDCVLALRAAFEARPVAAALARRGLSDGSLVRHRCGDSPLVCGWIALLAAEDDGAAASLAQGRQEAYRRGSVRAYGPVHAFSALDQLWRGNLAEAEREARAAVEAVERSGVRLGRPFVAPILADILLERGDPTGAAAALAWAGLPEEPPHAGPMYLYADTRARLLRRTEGGKRALDAALDAGRRFARFGGDNPALVPWRTEAARTLHRLGRGAEAVELALTEVALARRWGAPRPLGRALRVAGGVCGPADAVPLLSEAVEVLAGSSARLEYAKALTALATAAHRRGDRRWARELLDHASTLAAFCDSPPVRDRARAALAATGVRTPASGPADARVLTSSERRVAELAAAGQSNREIAETLYVTPKTVELHLTNTYRKLGITGRVQLVTALADTAIP
jgi:DNA-binding CsgD family transcriptional regulator